jgi:hypothetical protein
LFFGVGAMTERRGWLGDSLKLKLKAPPLMRRFGNLYLVC